MTISCYCGTVYSGTGDKSACPSCGLVASLPQWTGTNPQRKVVIHAWQQARPKA